ncbi:MAG TPA: glutathione peroxidase [Candidimonas sp.]|nr:glutathione peroxidase [Candidimonas sp.]
MTSVYSFSAQSLQGDTISLASYAGQVLLVVNVASACSFTPQYQGLQTLYTDYGERGFTVLGFPCNQFGHQEPGDAEQIANFCIGKYNVGFPMFEKIDVNGPTAHPLYKWLKSQKAGVLGSRKIKWNFTKFLVGSNGQVLRRYGSMTKPDALRRDIERALAEMPRTARALNKP